MPNIKISSRTNMINALIKSNDDPMLRERLYPKLLEHASTTIDTKDVTSILSRALISARVTFWEITTQDVYNFVMAMTNKPELATQSRNTFQRLGVAPEE